MSHKRTRAAEIARDTVRILTEGRYVHSSGKIVEIAHLLDAAQQGTITYPPGESLPGLSVTSRETAFATQNATTLAVARGLVSERFRPVALNFASARHPGGGAVGTQGQGARPCLRRLDVGEASG